MRILITIILTLALSTGVAFAEGGKNRGTTGSGTTSTGTSSQGSGSQPRAGR